MTAIRAPGMSATPAAAEAGQPAEIVIVADVMVIVVIVGTETAVIVESVGTTVEIGTSVEVTASPAGTIEGLAAIGTIAGPLQVRPEAEVVTAIEIGKAREKMTTRRKVTRVTIVPSRPKMKPVKMKRWTKGS